MPGRKLLTPTGYAERGCVLVQYWLPGLPHCYVICHEQNKGKLSSQKRDGLLQFFYAEAQRLAQTDVNDPEAFLFVHSGVSVRKRPDFHFHVFIVQSRWQKALAYSILAAKNFTQAFEFGIKDMFSKHE